MREIIFDTETTGLDPRDDRVIEFGGIEMVNRFPTGRTFHVYINAQGKTVNPEALAVHGISDADLADKPTFDAVAEDLIAFIDGATLIAHNAGFDVGFLNAEFARLGHPPLDPGLVVDTLALARRKHPMGPNSLDALCRRYGIDNSHRTKHGALLDSELLAEVYIELIGGKQAAFSLEVETEATVVASDAAVTVVVRQRIRPLTPRLSSAEIDAHRLLVEEIGSAALWHRLATPSAQPAETGSIRQ
jgi:DNA polymerase-3 subunit epsilon